MLQGLLPMALLLLLDAAHDLALCQMHEVHRRCCCCCQHTGL